MKGIWKPEAVRKACADNFTEWFNSHVKDKKRNEFDRNFHLSAKRAVRYKTKGRILDLLDGPVISDEDYRELQADPDVVDRLNIAATASEI